MPPTEVHPDCQQYAEGLARYTELTLHVRKTLTTVIHQLVKGALALPDPLPDGITVSIRRFAINPSGITFQPTLGALGTNLSQLPPP